MSVAAAIENVGISAYLGAAANISDSAVLTYVFFTHAPRLRTGWLIWPCLSDAASILCVENQHQAWIASAVNKGNPWSNSWGTPLPFDGVYTILAEFITGCPGEISLSSSFKPRTSIRGGG